MAHRLTILALACSATLGIARPVGAQDCAPAPGARQYTLGELLRSLDSSAARANLAADKPAAAAALDSISTLLRDAKAEPIAIGQIAQLIVARRVTVGEVARWSPEATSVVAQKWFRDAVLGLALIANGSILPALRAHGVPPAEIQSSLQPMLQLGTLVRACASAKSSEKLRRIEVKYGEGSPSLNLVEVGANYLAQWVPKLRPSPDGWPSRYELIAAYRPAEITASKSGDADAKASLVSAGQLGLRWYHWNPAWGTGSRLDQLKRPRHASLGAYAIGPNDKPLEKPWSKGSRVGAFLGWGDVHAAYVFESPRRLLIGHGKQIIPYVF
jgi:hypothetical protein